MKNSKSKCNFLLFYRNIQNRKLFLFFEKTHNKIKGFLLFWKFRLEVWRFSSFRKLRTELEPFFSSLREFTTEMELLFSSSEKIHNQCVTIFSSKEKFRTVVELFLFFKKLRIEVFSLWVTFFSILWENLELNRNVSSYFEDSDSKCNFFLSENLELNLNYYFSSLNKFTTEVELLLSSLENFENPSATEVGTIFLLWKIKNRSVTFFSFLLENSELKWKFFSFLGKLRAET